MTSMPSTRMRRIRPCPCVAAQKQRTLSTIFTQAENIFGKTYGHASHMAIAGDHMRFQWREQKPQERFQSSAKGELLDFGHPAKIEDGHVTYAHDRTNPARANYKMVAPPIFANHAYHIPGYGGFVPGVQSKNMLAAHRRRQHRPPTYQHHILHTVLISCLNFQVWKDAVQCHQGSSCAAL